MYEYVPLTISGPKHCVVLFADAITTPTYGSHFIFGTDAER
jgi:hypothetical protein